MRELSGRTAVVTGAGGGIGSALADELARAGMLVALWDIDEMALSAVAEQVGAQGTRVAVQRVDLTDALAVERAAARTLEQFGSVEVVCSNAGVLRPGAVWEQPAATWQHVVDVNLMGTVHLVNAFVPGMVRRGSEGHIVATVGVTAFFTSPFSPPASYAVSKHALLAYMEILSQELRAIGAPIQVSALCPSGVRSQIFSDPDNSDGETVRRPDVWPRLEALYTSIRNGLDPADVAAQVVQAIRRDQFWIYPNPQDVARVQHRADYIQAGEAPSAPPRIPLAPDA
jgi:NAD(P)-dependent dehydrogenase (short-subunit alcohol dehydrogenase family)